MYIFIAFRYICNIYICIYIPFIYIYYIYIYIYLGACIYREILHIEYGDERYIHLQMKQLKHIIRLCNYIFIYL